MNPLLAPGPTRVLGVLNVTPDSFSDGGRHAAHPDAVARGIALHAAGADLVDVGGESTRPGATRVEAAEELRRVLPVVEGLVAAGALVVNDVSGGLADEDMASTVAGLDCAYVLSHWRGFSDVMNSLATYEHVVPEVKAELRARLEAVTAAGVDRERIVLDPGLGFAKSAEHDWKLLGDLDLLDVFGLPLMVGASRKRFLGALLADADGVVPPPQDRDVATAVLTGLLAERGVWGVRVHDVASSVAAVKVVRSWQQGRTPAVPVGLAAEGGPS